MENSELTKKRYIDLSRMSYERGIYTFTDFLTLAELSDFFETTKSLYSNYSVFGGYEDAERCMVRFGSMDELGYDTDFPIACIKIAPLQKKFAEELTHRDFLGSLMNLGIERPKLGDIIIKDKEALLFATEALAPTICSEITRIRHTSVLATIVEASEVIPKREFKEELIQIKSERIDAIIAKTYNLSRSQAQALFLQKKVFINGRIMENESHNLKPDSVVSVRGFGRFIYDGESGTTKKGNVLAKIKKYV